jgi:hypothetical protein
VAHKDLLQPEIDVRAVTDYDPVWPELFAALGRDLRARLGGVALRIDHIGSTAVAGLAAKRDAHSPIAHAYGFMVLTLRGERVAAITGFPDTSVFAHFGLPRTLRQ